ncbi:T9SS type A sorting domain-containing protein [Flavobacterium sp.]
MKHFITLISIICSINAFSQTPDSELFQTWYLYDYYSTDDNIHHPVAAISPAISPRITFTDASPYSFSGQGACNSFLGTFSSPAAGFLNFDDFAATLLLCNYQNHTTFESSFFSLLQVSGQYTILGEGDNMTLLISTPIFMNYVFGNSQLSKSNFDLEQALVYPNPVDSNVFVNAPNNVIDKIEILNSLGQTIKTINTGFEVIDTSGFSSGVYLMKLYSEGRTVTKKIIKK